MTGNPTSVKTDDQYAYLLHAKKTSGKYMRVKDLKLLGES